MSSIRALREAVVGMAVMALVLAGCTSASRSDSSNPFAGERSRPNIVFVLTDDLDKTLVRYMPHLEQLRRDGASFSNYSVTDSLCCPSRASILTGRFPHNTGIFTNAGKDGGFNLFHARGEEGSTIGTQLRHAGYRTGFMGKYLNGYWPRETMGGERPYVPPGWHEWDAAGDAYGEYDYTLNENGTLTEHGSAPRDYLTDVLASKGQQFITDAARAGKPFFLELSTFAPHSPATAAPRHEMLFRDLKAPRDRAFDEADMSDKPTWLRDHPRLNGQQTSRIDKAFGKRVRSVQAVDDLLARLRSTLRSTGESGNTFVVFSSDNGFHLGQHRLAAGKQTAFDTDITVPLVVSGPGVPADRTVGAPVENIDLRPTFGKIAGVRTPADVDGRSIMSLLRGRAEHGWRTAALVEHHGPVNDRSDPDRQHSVSGNPPSYAAIRTTRGTYVEYADGDREYYDRQRDPYQLTNVYSSLPQRDRNSLHSTLEKLVRCHGAAECWVAAHTSE